ncbi:MAG: helix-turn-helix transcriptional regulator [Methylovulum sp.]|uniref:helix-turn-helix domain-containing protein n=1 Tax=Methylovulum sp. TaxID=1916980 RepID=UPI00260B1671|nr:helix-turn-helix transcriptional regulator [Methylovulum sp.]MDD2723722.1 helix-turn-helix transcriptional regulator [Methylovulum sp.]MDD5123304.1 helix-turn-helix transcriptional regulator [Methylovulum sp.]
MKVNEKIRTIRQLKEVSQEEMAEKLGISKNTYANIERGETDVQLSRLEQIAQTFEMDLVELFNFGEKTVACLIGNNNQFSNFGQNISDSKETQFELQKAQLLIEQQLKEIAYLKEIIELTKDRSKA